MLDWFYLRSHDKPNDIYVRFGNFIECHFIKRPFAAWSIRGQTIDNRIWWKFLLEKFKIQQTTNNFLFASNWLRSRAADF